jgi:hypothetical protein
MVSPLAIATEGGSYLFSSVYQSKETEIKPVATLSYLNSVPLRDDFINVLSQFSHEALMVTARTFANQRARR